MEFRESRALICSQSSFSPVVIRWQRRVPFSPEVPVRAGAPMAVAAETVQPWAPAVTSRRSTMWVRGASWPARRSVYAVPESKEHRVRTSSWSCWPGVGCAWHVGVTPSVPTSRTAKSGYRSMSSGNR